MDLPVLVLMGFLCLPGWREGRGGGCSSRRLGCSCVCCCCRRATRQARRRGRGVLLQEIPFRRIWCIDREVDGRIALLRRVGWSVHGAGGFAMGVWLSLLPAVGMSLHSQNRYTRICRNTHSGTVTNLFFFSWSSPRVLASSQFGADFFFFTII